MVCRPVHLHQSGKKRRKVYEAKIMQENPRNVVDRKVVEGLTKENGQIRNSEKKRQNSKHPKRRDTQTWNSTIKWYKNERQRWSFWTWDTNRCNCTLNVIMWCNNGCTCLSWNVGRRDFIDCGSQYITRYLFGNFTRAAYCFCSRRWDRARCLRCWLFAARSSDTWKAVASVGADIRYRYCRCDECAWFVIARCACHISCW